MRKLIALNGEEVTTGTITPGTLYIGTGGDLKCTLQNMTDGTYITFKNIPDGTNFPRVVKYIHTDSTVSDVIVDKI